MRLKSVRPLRADEFAELTAMFKTRKDVRLVHRCHAILLSADGWRVSKIATFLHVDQATAHRWLAADERASWFLKIHGARPAARMAPEQAR